MNGKNLLRLLITLVIIAAILGGYLFVNSSPSPTEAAQPPVPKYIFIFLADGAGITHLGTARMYSWHNHDEGLMISRQGWTFPPAWSIELTKLGEG